MRLTMVILFVLSSVWANAQTQDNRLCNMDGGVQILYQSSNPTPVGAGASAINTAIAQSAISTIECGSNIVSRVFTTPDSGKVVSGFAMHFDSVRGGSAFHVSVQAIPGVPFYAATISDEEVSNGGRIQNVFPHPATGALLMDTVQVGKGVLMQFMPMPHRIPGTLPSTVSLSLVRPTLYSRRGGQESRLPKSDDQVTGGLIIVTPSGHDRFFLSSTDRPGFNKEGFVEGRRLSFVSENDYYVLTSEADITATQGTWHVWVKREPSPATIATINSTTPAASVRLSLP